MSSSPPAADWKRAFDKWLTGRWAEYPGWQTRTRPRQVNFNGFIQHHTGGPKTHSDSYLKFLFETGRPAEGIPGPLCNVATDDLGIVHLGSRLSTNNAGSGDVDTLNHVIREDYPGFRSPELDPGADNYDTGNARYIGNEIMYPGTVPMNPVQYESSVLFGAAICDLFGWSPLSMVGHREHSSRKGDPYGVQLYDMRDDVQTALTVGPSWRLDDDDMDQATFTKFFLGAIKTTAVREALVEAVLGTDNVIPAPSSAPDRATNPHWAGQSFLRTHVDDGKKILAKLDTTPPPGTTLVSGFTDDAKADMARAVVDEEADRLQQS